MRHFTYAKNQQKLLPKWVKLTFWLNSLTIALYCSATPPATAGTITQISQENTFSIKNGQVQTTTTFEFDAHPDDKETVNRALSLLPKRGNTSTTVKSREFIDDHRTKGRGVAVYGITKQNKKFTLSEQVSASITPNCPRKALDCGPVSMKTTTKNKTTITALSNEVKANNLPLLSNDVVPQVLAEMSIDVLLSKGTKVSLFGQESSQKSLGVNDDSNLLYEFDLSVVEDEIVLNHQRLAPQVTIGTSNDYFSLTFDSDAQTIQNRIADAFSYNSAKNTWVVSEDTNLFSVSLTPLQDIESFDLLGESSQEKDAIEPPSSDVQSIPESSSVFGFLMIGALGTVSIMKRHLNSSQSSNPETTEINRNR